MFHGKRFIFNEEVIVENKANQAEKHGISPGGGEGGKATREVQDGEGWHYCVMKRFYGCQNWEVEEFLDLITHQRNS